MSKKYLLQTLTIVIVILTTIGNAVSAGNVYLVIGSDTAIWDGMNVGRYNCTYNQSLYTDPGRNAYTVMAPSFRAGMVDSYGQPMKMTWWMMAGNIFRYATNTNIPVPNIMTLYLMKKYHGDELQINGDELSLHYHTFFWSDYDRDGMYFWNQSKTFLESKADFDVTLAQFLLEERVFPVSFRSGWHFMDNDWQRYLDERILPYSMDNDYPHKKTSDPEPIDNIYDWSKAPSAFIPYRPSEQNYQLPGNGPGWQVRSASFWGVRVNDYMDTIFAAANKGQDQIACFWSHLPQANFPDNMQMIDSLAHQYADKYPEVKFRYCTAVEAMQRWRKSTDKTPPVLTFREKIVGDNVYFTVKSDESLFQKQPFVAVKTLYEKYLVLECSQTGKNQWKTIQPVLLSSVAKAGVTACDSLGNQSMEFISHLPEDVFIDNGDNGYREENGNWSSSSSYSWGTDSRVAELNNDDSAQVAWTYLVHQTTPYNIFIQFPEISNRADNFSFIIFDNAVAIDTINIKNGLPAKKWNYLSTIQAVEGSTIKIQMSAFGNNQSGKVLTADVLKITPLVRERYIRIMENLVDFGPVSIEDSVRYNLKIYNNGIHSLHLSDIYSLNQFVTINVDFPIEIPAMSEKTVPLYLLAHEIGTLNDTLEIISDDPMDQKLTLKISAEIMQYFHTIDNEDSNEYEEFGTWHTSVANIYGPSSRYAWLNSKPLASARFYTTLKKSGDYELFEIVPSTVNSTNDALYQVKINGVVQASYHVDQNAGSGSWISIGTLFLPADTEVELWITDTGNNTASGGAVIRTDAVRFKLLENGTSIYDPNKNQKARTFLLEQNYPNPFNPNTTINYQLASTSNVELSIYNALGQKITTLIRMKQKAGNYSKSFNAHNLSSGIYYYRITAGSFTQVRKMVLLR